MPRPTLDRRHFVKLPLTRSCRCPIADEEKVNSVIRQAHALQRAGVGAPLLGAGVLAGAVALADDVAGLAPRRTDRVHVCFTSDKYVTTSRCF